MRSLSGLKPSGLPHIGNYFGAIQQWIDLQTQGEGLYFIADLHALDGIRDPVAMREHTLGAAIDYLALGLDPEQCTLFVQSDVPEISELMWILGHVAPMGMLGRAHAYKDAQAKGREVDFGRFAYPILMAADILLYGSEIVPVGKDQKQHVEITRDLAVKFNQTYCPDFDPATGLGGALRLPEPLIVEAVAVVPGTDGRKMSKSYGNTVDLFGTDKQVKKQIMRIVTDSIPVEAPKDPETDNVYAMLKLFLGEAELAEVASQYRQGGTGYGDFKKRLLACFHAAFDDVRARRIELARDEASVRQVLAAGAVRAREIGRPILDAVQRACGLR